MFEGETQLKEVDPVESFREEIEQAKSEESTHLEDVNTEELNELDRAMFEEFKAVDTEDPDELNRFGENFTEYRSLIEETGNESQKAFVSYLGNKIGAADILRGEVEDASK